jgi:transcriptional regulator GlxA family with amidase domain
MHIDIVIFDGFDELDAIAPFEMLRAAGLDTRLVVLAGRERRVTARHGLVLEAHGTIAASDVAKGDWVVAVGGGYLAGATSGVKPEIVKGELPALFAAARDRGAVLGSVCTGAMLLAAAGLVRGRRAITHHTAIADLAAAGATIVNERVVDDGDLVTAGGVTSGLDFGLHLVGRILGDDARRKASERAEYPPPTRAGTLLG